jgi:tRNA threonylcarbamoyladenosine biosynthesis protein TsaE
MMQHFVYQAEDEAATAALGRALAEVLPPRTTVALCGTLGAGKTRLIQAIAAGSGIDPRDVLSPTFVLVQEHHGRRTIYHLDAYRLHGADEFLDLGPDEFFESDALTLIEWADRVAVCLPGERIDVQIDVTGPQSRQFTIRAVGARFEPAIGLLAERLRE